MLDNFTIVHSSGLILWSKNYSPTFQSTSPIGALIRTALIESRSEEQRFDTGGYCCKWNLANDVGLTFIAVHQRILHLAYVPTLLGQVRELFLTLFRPFLGVIAGQTGNSGEGAGGLDNEARQRFAEALKDWDAVFTSTLRKLEREAALQARSSARANKNNTSKSAGQEASTPTSIIGNNTTSAASPNDDQAIAKNIEALKARLKGVEITGGTRKKAGTAKPSSATVTPSSGGPSTPTGKKKGGKEMRKWDANGNAIVVSGDAGDLDFSNNQSLTPRDEQSDPVGSLSGWVDEKSMGTVGQDGMYEVADALQEGQDGDDDDDDDDEDEEEDDNSAAASSAGTGFLSGLATRSGAGSLLSRMTGSGHALTSAELQPTLSAMQTHLQSKNVAADVAQRLCTSVGRSLEGKTISGFASIKKQVRSALQEAIVRTLTPRNSTDLLLEINDKLNRQEQQGKEEVLKDPYTIAFVGVNGVGKSTNLAKVCFWLLQNRKRVLIAACDTFRSGAVEQLRVHVRNLGELQVGGEYVKERDSNGYSKLELFEKGYGKDSSGICSSAISYAKKNHFDIVLIDTAGRMQDNEPLMRSLSKLISVNTPNKVIFVGEALVGNEAIDQLTKFNRSLQDFSEKARGLDGILLTKFDTVDGKVGTALTVTSVTGLPIFFVGVGQTYTDLKQLRVGHIVSALMQD
ncbi:unnamed protein product [Sympodiomycopsis kandeliae]